MTNQGSKGNHVAPSKLKTTFTSREVIWREAQWGQMRVGYETYLTDFNDTALLKGLPNDQCQCPHWGYLLAGRMTVTYSDHQDVVEASEAYYMAPGHTMAVEAGTVLIEFSPKDKFQELMDFAEQNMARLKNVQDN